MLLVSEKMSLAAEILRKVVFGNVAVPSECAGGTWRKASHVEVRITGQRNEPLSTFDYKTAVDASQTDLDAWLDQYNNEREHQGAMVLRQETEAHLPRFTGTRQGETHSSLTASSLTARLPVRSSSS